MADVAVHSRVAISQAEAREFGLKTYFSGAPCKNGHLADRSALNRTCVVCLKEKGPAANRRYRSKHPERCRASNRAYAKRNPDKILAKVRKRQTGVGRAMLACVDPKSIAKFYKEARELTEKTGVKHSVDHIFPLKGPNFCGLHVPWNLRVIPHVENLKKGWRVPTGFECVDAAAANEFPRAHHGGLCKRGHDLSVDGMVYTYPDGRKSCRGCHRISSKEYAVRTNYAAQKRQKAKLKMERKKLRAWPA